MAVYTLAREQLFHLPIVCQSTDWLLHADSWGVKYYISQPGGGSTYSRHGDSLGDAIVDVYL